MNKETLMRFAVPVAAVAASVGIGFAGISAAQSTSTGTSTNANIPATAAVTTSASATADDPTETGTASDPADSRSDTHRHAPMGHDGIISAISGSTITMVEETDEGSGSYTVDASKASVDQNGTVGALSSLKVGDKIFVDGTLSGTSMTATSIKAGYPGHDGGKSESEGAEPSGSTDGRSDN